MSGRTSVPIMPVFIYIAFTIRLYIIHGCRLRHRRSCSPASYGTSKMKSEPPAGSTTGPFNPPQIMITEPASEDVADSATHVSSDVDSELLALIDEPQPAPTSNPVPAFFAPPPVREAAKKGAKAIGKLPTTTTTVKAAPTVRNCMHFKQTLFTYLTFRDEGKPLPRPDLRRLGAALALEAAAVQVQSPTRRRSLHY